MALAGGSEVRYLASAGRRVVLSALLLLGVGVERAKAAGPGRRRAAGPVPPLGPGRDVQRPASAGRHR